MIGHVNTEKNQGATDVCHERHGFVEEDGAGNNRGDGIKINVVGGSHGSDFSDDPAPKCKANEGSNEA